MRQCETDGEIIGQEEMHVVTCALSGIGYACA
jgi:hypothetical protein